MNAYKTRLIFALTGYGLLVGAGIAAILHYCFPGFSWNWFLAVFIFFLALEILIVNLIANNSRSGNDKRLVNIYMLTKVLKVVLSLAFILVYFLVERTMGIKPFIIIFIAFYLLFLIAETYLLTKIERHIKLKSNNEE
jgi:hypothetical protein